MILAALDDPTPTATHPMIDTSPASGEPRTENVYLGSSVADAFYEAKRRWGTQRDDASPHFDTHEIVEQAFAAHGLAIVEAEAAAGPTAGLDEWKERALKAERFIGGITADEWATIDKAREASRLAARSAAGTGEESTLCAECGGRRCPTCGQGCIDPIEAHPATQEDNDE